MSDLRERVAALLEANEQDGHWPSVADAAIALIRGEVLEEAARVALDEYRRSSSGEEIAAAIRALKEKE